MKIDVIASANEIKCELIENKNIVIIDVLRATSVIVTALANGAKYIVPMKSVEETHNYKLDNDCEDLLLCGEREAKIVSGFNYGNSPLDYTKINVGNKIIVHTTSNGTRAIKACDRGANVYIASFLNVSAVVDKILRENLDTVIVCSGTNNQFSMDDSICAGMIISMISRRADITMSDISWSVKEIYENNRDNIYSFLSKTCYHFRLLEEIGFFNDLEYCLKQNIYDIVPYYSNGKIKIN